jgi:hypothetical protein
VSVTVSSKGPAATTSGTSSSIALLRASESHGQRGVSCRSADDPASVSFSFAWKPSITDMTTTRIRRLAPTKKLPISVISQW